MPNYYPVMIEREKPIKKGGNKQSEAIAIAITEQSKSFGESSKTYNLKNPTTAGSLLFSNREAPRGLHPTQKPVALMEYLIKTYSNIDETVLDFTAGSFTTGVAAVNLGRKFIGVEMDQGYFEIGVNRVAEALL